MAPIDDKVVAMSFENSKFESGVSKTLTSLDKLKAALKFPDAGKGLENIDAAGRRVDLSHIGRGVDDIKAKLGYLSVAALAVFADIARRAFATGASLVKAFTIDPIKAGFQEYATNLNAVQTILANTQAAGATLKDVNAALLDLNKYSDRTIYNFSQMAKNIGTFTAAGVDLKTSTQAIKGIANLAALSGSNADQAATAMYQLSQAISAGRVGLQDWNSVVNAGMGGTVFQRALAQTAVSMGKLKESSLKLVGPMKNVSINGESFRQSMQAVNGKTWLTSDVLTNTLKQFTGDMTDAQLKAEGFTAAQIKSIQQTAKTAMFAATEVKTLSQVIDVAKETAGSGWAQTWQIIFGDFGEAKRTFTALSNAINGFINASAESRNKVLADWKALGGRTVLIYSIKTLFQNLGEILKPIKEAFRDIFPAKTGKDLVKLTYEFKHFAESLKPSKETAENLKRTFAGFFAVLDIGKQIISGILSVFGQLFGVVGKGSSGFLGFTANIGDFLVALDKALKEGDGLTNFFNTIGSVLSAPIELLEALGHALSDLFSGFSPGGFFQEMDGITKAMTPFQKVMTAIAEVWNKFLEAVSNSGANLQHVFDSIIQLVASLGPAIGKAASTMNFEAILQVIRTGLFAGIFLMMKEFLGKGSFLEQLSGKRGILGNIAGSFNALQGSMKAMQNNLKAKTLKELAIAIALLTASVVALSFINPEKLKYAITAMGFIFAELLGAMAVLDKISKGPGFLKLPIIMGSLILLAGAISILTLSVLALSRLSWEQLSKGLGGLGILLGGIVLAVKPLSASSLGLIKASVGLTVIAGALILLMVPIKMMAAMNLPSLAKGLGGLGAGLAIMVTAMNKMPVVPVKSTIGLIAMATALVILASAIQTMGAMDLASLGKGLGGVAGGLILMVFAMQKMPAASMMKNAVALVLMASGIRILADAIVKMGAMSVEEIAKGLVVLGGSLKILSVGLMAMTKSVPGAMALGIAAVGLSLLAPALVAMGRQSWEQIVKGLAALAGAMLIIGVAGKLLTPAVPAMLGFGAALLLIGAGLALAGAGVALVGMGLSAIAVAGPTAVGILIAALIQLTEALPRILKNTVLGLLEMVRAFAATAPLFVDALVKILDSLLQVIIESSPKIAEAFTALLIVVLKVLHDNQGKVIKAGFELLMALLQGIKNNIGRITTTVVDIIVNFLKSLANNMGRIIKAGTDVVIALIKGIVNGFGRIVTAGFDVLAKFLGSIASGIGRVVTAGFNILIKFLSGIANNIGRAIKAGADAIIAFVTGIGSAAGRVVTAGVDTIIKFIQGIGKNAVRLARAAAQTILDFLNGLRVAIEVYAPQIRTASLKLGWAIIDGMTGGVLGKAGELYGKVKEVAGKALEYMKKPWKVLSPSKVMYELGEAIIEGLELGITNTAPKVYTAAEILMQGIIDKFNAAFLPAPTSPIGILGAFIGKEFATGIAGSTDDITSAFAELNTKLTEAMATARANVATQLNIQIKEFEKAHPDPKVLLAAQKVILANNDVMKRATEAHQLLVTTLKAEGIELLKVTVEYDTVTEKLSKAKDVLVEAMRTRDEAIKSYSDQYSKTPDIAEDGTQQLADFRASIANEQKQLDALLGSGEQDAEKIAAARASLATETQKLNDFLQNKVLDSSGNSIDLVATYLLALKNQRDAVGAYSATLDQLRVLGLDDATYQKLLTEGTADQSFASQLLAGGKTAVESLNTLDTQLMNVSATLATNAANNLYQAGVDAAQGLVNGLESQKDELYKAMTRIGNGMIAALKKALKIKSPSEAFAEIGRFSMTGMAEGFSNSTKLITNAVEDAASKALSAMKKGMRNISDLVSDELNPNPVITPILDLTQIRKDAQELAGLTDMPISATASFGQAAIISSEQTRTQTEETPAVPAGTSVKFEQNNYSPEALSEIDIYRQTKNQLSQLRSVLALS